MGAGQKEELRIRIRVRRSWSVLEQDELLSRLSDALRTLRSVEDEARKYAVNKHFGYIK